jgi:hypothetical protein
LSFRFIVSVAFAVAQLFWPLSPPCPSGPVTSLSLSEKTLRYTGKSTNGGAPRGPGTVGPFRWSGCCPRAASGGSTSRPAHTWLLSECSAALGKF